LAAQIVACTRSVGVGVAEDEVVRRLVQLFAKLAASSRAEATAFALRDGLV